MSNVFVEENNFLVPDDKETFCSDLENFCNKIGLKPEFGYRKICIPLNVVSVWLICSCLSEYLSRESFDSIENDKSASNILEEFGIFNKCKSYDWRQCKNCDWMHGENEIVGILFAEVVRCVLNNRSFSYLHFTLWEFLDIERFKDFGDPLSRETLNEIALPLSVQMFQQCLSRIHSILQESQHEHGVNNRLLYLTLVSGTILAEFTFDFVFNYYDYGDRIIYDEQLEHFIASLILVKTYSEPMDRVHASWAIDWIARFIFRYAKEREYEENFKFLIEFENVFLKGLVGTERIARFNIERMEFFEFFFNFFLDETRYSDSIFNSRTNCLYRFLSFTREFERSLFELSSGSSLVLPIDEFDFRSFYEEVFALKGFFELAPLVILNRWHIVGNLAKSIDDPTKFAIAILEASDEVVFSLSSTTKTETLSFAERNFDKRQSFLVKFLFKKVLEICSTPEDLSVWDINTLLGFVLELSSICEFSLNEDDLKYEFVSAIGVDYTTKKSEFIWHTLKALEKNNFVPKKLLKFLTNFFFLLSSCEDEYPCENLYLFYSFLLREFYLVCGNNRNSVKALLFGIGFGFFIVDKICEQLDYFDVCNKNTSVLESSSYFANLIALSVFNRCHSLGIFESFKSELYFNKNVIMWSLYVQAHEKIFHLFKFSDDDCVSFLKGEYYHKDSFYLNLSGFVTSLFDYRQMPFGRGMRFEVFLIAACFMLRITPLSFGDMYKFIGGKRLMVSQALSMSKGQDFCDKLVELMVRSPLDTPDGVNIIAPFNVLRIFVDGDVCYVSMSSKPIFPAESNLFESTNKSMSLLQLSKFLAKIEEGFKILFGYFESSVLASLFRALRFNEKEVNSLLAKQRRSSFEDFCQLFMEYAMFNLSIHPKVKEFFRKRLYELKEKAIASSSTSTSLPEFSNDGFIANPFQKVGEKDDDRPKEHKK